MKVPTPRKLPSGNWFIQLRLNGVSVPVTASTAKGCKDKAALIKAEHRAGKSLIDDSASLTVSQCFDRYLADRGNSLSPLTIRGYRIIQNNRFRDLMQKNAWRLKKSDCQKAVDAELEKCARKTVLNGIAAVRTVVKDATGKSIPRVSLPVPVKKEAPFLQPEEIPRFIDAVKATRFAVPLLLCLSSLRISEVSALRWSDVSEKAVSVSGAVVLNEKNKWVEKKENKTEGSSRLVPVLIPELAEAIRRDRTDPNAFVMPYSQNTLRRNLHLLCQREGITDVAPHQLRHSFASLCYHLQVPYKITADIGGWEDEDTLRKIYEHLAKSDLKRYRGELQEFFNR